jgi:hypothetical protein
MRVSVKRALLFGITLTGMLAQTDRAVITGTVKDASGAAVPGANVTATHLTTKANSHTTTSRAGKSAR